MVVSDFMVGILRCGNEEAFREIISNKTTISGVFFYYSTECVCVCVCVRVHMCVCDDYMYVSQNVLVVGLQRNNFLIVLFVSF